MARRDITSRRPGIVITGRAALARDALDVAARGLSVDPGAFGGELRADALGGLGDIREHARGFELSGVLGQDGSKRALRAASQDWVYRAIRRSGHGNGNREPCNRHD